MNNAIMPTRADFTESALLEAIRMIRAEEKPRAMVGADESQFFEIEISPDADELSGARAVVQRLIDNGLGLKLTVNWSFVGTKRWAVRAANMRVVNHGV